METRAPEETQEVRSSTSAMNISAQTQEALFKGSKDAAQVCEAEKTYAFMLFDASCSEIGSALTSEDASKIFFKTCTGKARALLSSGQKPAEILRFPPNFYKMAWMLPTLLLLGKHGKYPVRGA